MKYQYEGGNKDTFDSFKGLQGKNLFISYLLTFSFSLIPFLTFSYFFFRFLLLFSLLFASGAGKAREWNTSVDSTLSGLASAPG